MAKSRTVRDNDPLAQMRNANRAPAEPLLSTPASVERHENQAAALVGGKRHRGSGASDFKKSDASSDEFQIECKQTAKMSLTVQLDWIEKISMEAAAHGRWPMVHLEFLAASPHAGRRWVMIPDTLFARLMQRPEDEGE